MTHINTSQEASSLGHSCRVLCLPEVPEAGAFAQGSQEGTKAWAVALLPLPAGPGPETWDTPLPPLWQAAPLWGFSGFLPTGPLGVTRCFRVFP